MECLEEVRDDKFNNMKVKNITTPGNIMVTASSDLASTLKNNQDLWRKISREFLMTLASVVRETNLLHGESKEKMWNKILHYQDDCTLSEFFNPILREKYSEPTISSLMFALTTTVVKRIFILENQLYRDTLEVNIETELTNKEQEVIYYVSGYILFSLIKRYKKFDESGNVEAKDALVFFSSLKGTTQEVECHNFLHFVKKWTNLVDRGGLIKVNDQFFIFIRYVETIVRKILTFSFMKTYRGQDIRGLLHEKLEESSMIRKLWEGLTRNMPNKQLADHLLHQVLSKWVDIRANAFVKTFLLILKRNIGNATSKQKNKNLKSQPAMRKTLT